MNVSLPTVPAPTIRLLVEGKSPCSGLVLVPSPNVQPSNTYHFLVASFHTRSGFFTEKPSSAVYRVGFLPAASFTDVPSGAVTALRATSAAAGEPSALVYATV